MYVSPASGDFDNNGLRDFVTIYNVIETEMHSTDTLFTYYTRFSNDTVYRWVNNQEYLFFHFQLQLDVDLHTFSKESVKLSCID